MEHRHRAVELRLHRWVTGDREIYLTESSRIACGMLVLGNSGHRACQPRTGNHEANMRESHTDLLVWVQKDVSMVTESRKQANAPTASTSKNDSHLKTHRFFHKKKSSFRRDAETNTRDPHTGGQAVRYPDGDPPLPPRRLVVKFSRAVSGPTTPPCRNQRQRQGWHGGRGGDTVERCL